MKRVLICSIVLVSLLFSSCGANKRPVLASSVDSGPEVVSISETDQIDSGALETVSERFRLECEEKWYETRDYPIKYGDEVWEDVSYPDKMEILNPPEDLLETFTMDELAHLFLTYPLFPYMPWFGDNETNLFFATYTEYSTIASKFLESDERFEYLMKEYRATEFNYEAVKCESFDDFCDVSVWADNVVIYYILAYGADFTEEEKDIYCGIRDEKYEKYYSKIDDPNKNVSSYKILFDEPLPHREGCTR